MARDELEKRIARLENRVQLMEDRRKALIPAELEDNPNVRLVLRDSLDGFAAKLKAFAEQKGLDEAQTRFTAAKAEAARELERIVKEGEEKEAAELVAAIDYFERTGRNPPGYEFSVEIQR
jgi:hypothetical protein